MRVVEGAGYSGTQTAKIVGITYRQLDYWARTDLLKPSLAEATGQREPPPVQLPRPARAAHHQDAARRRHQARVRARRVQEPAGERRHRHQLGQHRDQRHDVGRAADQRRADRADEQGPGRPQHPPAGRRQGRRRRRDRVTAQRRRRARHCTNTPYDARALAARRRPPCPRGADGALRRLGDAARVSDGHDRRTPRLPHRRRGVRRVAISVRSVSTGPTAFDTLQRAADQRPRPRSPRAAPSTPTSSIRDDASVLDDIIVWWHPDSDDGTARFDVMPNASNTDRVRRRRRREWRRPTSAPCSPCRDRRPRIAWRRSGRRPRRSAGSGSATPTWNGAACTVAGTGYTGEAGVEIAVPGGVAPRTVGRHRRRRRAAGRTRRTRHPATRGRPPAARPRARPGITPLQAGLGWVVAWVKPDFRGRAALAAEQARGVDRHLVGLAVEGRRPPRADCPILVDGDVVGTVTSGNFSPTLGHGIALGFVPPHIDDRRRRRHRRSGHPARGHGGRHAVRRPLSNVPSDAVPSTLPSGVVTFLFTDIEGSTHRWESDPDEMRVALAHHDWVLGSVIEAHGGRMFKHTGDGVCAAFSSARQAVDAAIAAQLQLTLPVRMGLATGEVEAAGVGLLRRDAEPDRPGDVGGPRRADLAGGIDRGPPRRGRPPRPRVAPAPRSVGGAADLSGSGSGSASRLSPAPDGRHRPGQPSGSGDQLHRSARRGRRARRPGSRSSAGDVDRGRWGRQDPSGSAGRRRADVEVRRRRVVRGTGPRRGSSRCAQRGSHRAGSHPPGRPDRHRELGVGPRWSTAADRARQLRARPRHGRGAGRRRSSRGRQRSA